MKPLKTYKTFNEEVNWPWNKKDKEFFQGYKGSSWDKQEKDRLNDPNIKSIMGIMGDDFIVSIYPSSVENMKSYTISKKGSRTSVASILVFTDGLVILSNDSHKTKYTDVKSAADGLKNRLDVKHTTQLSKDEEEARRFDDDESISLG